MRKLFIILFLFLFASPAYAWMNVVTMGGSTPGGCSMTCIEDVGFEGVGAPSIRWSTLSGSPNYDKATTDLDMIELKCYESISSEVLLTPASGYGELYISLRVRKHTSLSGYENWLNLRTVFGTSQANYYFHSDSGGQHTAIANTGTEDRVNSGITINTSYYILIYYKKGTGLNAIARMWLWDGSAWGGMSESSDGNGTSDIQQIRIYDDVYIDNLKVSQTLIEDPTCVCTP